MNIAIIGSAHPYKGGIAQHTTELAHHLAAAGHQTTLISWRNQYPPIYPGVPTVPHNKPERPLFTPTLRVLSWANPLGWWKWGRKLRAYDKVIFVWWVPLIQGPVYWLMLRALGTHYRQTVLICHNVLQHKAGKFDHYFAKLIIGSVGRVIVHSDAQAQLARTFTTTVPVTALVMATHLPNTPKHSADHSTLRNRLLFFGLLRPYKGVDILIQALAQVPDTTLTIAGEAWGKNETLLRQLIHELNLESRVDFRPGYVPSDEIEELFAGADALVLPYRSGTATQNADLAFAHGIPVIATRVGNLSQRLRDGTDSLLCQPEDVASLTTIIKHFYEPGVAAYLRAHIPVSESSEEWQTYINTLTRLT